MMKVCPIFTPVFHEKILGALQGCAAGENLSLQFNQEAKTETRAEAWREIAEAKMQRNISVQYQK